MIKQTDKNGNNILYIVLYNIIFPPVEMLIDWWNLGKILLAGNMENILEFLEKLTFQKHMLVYFLAVIWDCLGPASCPIVSCFKVDGLKPSTAQWLDLIHLTIQSMLPYHLKELLL